jgi:hypothetical protein
MTKKATTPPSAPDVETPDVETPSEGKSIVFLRSHPNYAYNAGNRATLSQEHTDLLVNGGFARFDEAETAEAPTDEPR